MAVRFDCQRTVFMDYDRIVLPLTIRSMQPGDRMQPLGMATMKKLKNEFVDRKIPVRIRKQFPLLVDTHSVLWMIGHMLSERVKITDKTIKILKIEMI
jgi:tRNA(Ile)-lysidine synthase